MPCYLGLSKGIIDSSWLISPTNLFNKFVFPGLGCRAPDGMGSSPILHLVSTNLNDIEVHLLQSRHENVALT